MKRLIVVAVLLVSPAALAAPYALPDEYLMVAGTGGAAGAVASTNTAAAAAVTTPATAAGEPAKRFPRQGYFFLAYAIVWGGLAAYVAFLATRIVAIEARLPRRP